MPKPPFDRFRRLLLARCHSREVCDRLSAIGRSQEVCRNEDIALDKAGDQLVFLARGATKLVMTMPDASEHVLAFHFAGDVIHLPRRAQGRLHLRALDECDAIAFPADAFLDVAESEPNVLRMILSRTLMALQRSRDKAVRLQRKAAQERIADFLLGMAERIGESEAGATLLDLPMSRRDIGNSLGLTIETVSRQFTELREDGVISTSGRSLVRLHDLDELAIRAGHAPQSNARNQICAESKNNLNPPAIAAAHRGI